MKRCQHISRTIVLISVAFQLNSSFSQDRSMYMQPCSSVIPNKPVTLLVAHLPPELVLSKSSTEIAEISENWGNDPTRKGNSKKFHSYGFTGTTVLISVESDAQGLYLIPNRKPINESEQPKLMCFKAGANIKLSYEKNSVYLSKDFQNNKCMYDGIKRHELLHARLNDENLTKLGDDVKRYAEKLSNGKIFFVENSRFFDGKSFAWDINNYAKKRWDEMLESHNSIDENYTVDEIKKECKI